MKTPALSLLFVVLPVLACVLSASAQATAQPIFGSLPAEARAAYEAAAVPLWNTRAPHSKGDDPADLPLLYPVLPPKGDHPVGVVLVLPGGGYRVHAAHEAFPIAEYFRAQGLAAFVLRYRLRPYDSDVSLLDAQRAVRLIRARATDWGVDASKISAIGFSAGGHLAANLATHADDGNRDAADHVDRQSSRLQTTMLIYPWLVFDRIDRTNSAARALPGLLALDGLHRSVNAQTPPTYLVVGYEDDRTPYEHCLVYAAKLHEAGVRFELHVLGLGGHGFAMRGIDPRLQVWPQMAVNWLSTCGFLPSPAPAR